jgi:hypothetical protein
MTAAPCVAQSTHVLVPTDKVQWGPAPPHLNRQASQTLEPGAFVSLPAKMRHFAWTATPAVVQLSLEGSFDIFYVNPADNPQKPLTKR